MKRILVVDDEPCICRLLAALLSDDGFDTVVAHGTLKAIERARQARMDLAIIDIRMPVVDGFEALKALALLRPKVPVVAMSGSMLPPDADDFDGMRILARTLGADYCLRKPFTAADVRAAVDACLSNVQ